ncbi:MAG TPA: peroxidase family protein [Acidimicrobiales bacterium]|nr:peroxidase family protein [Acidimicrobiales bacterium]
MSSLFGRVYDRLAELADRRFGWHRVPKPLGLLILIGVRNVLRRENLYDTTHEPAVDTPPVSPPEPRYRTVRTADGTHNDLDQPAMGMAGSRFGRNVPIERTWPEPQPALLRPSPRTVSRELLTREPFQPATTVNALVSAWLQFMIRDWFSHGKSPTENPIEIPLEPDDPWPAKPMQVMRTRPDPTRPPGSSDLPPTYTNTETHWWDLSSIYGSSKKLRSIVRTGVDGKLHVTAAGLIPYPTDPDLDPARVPGFWLGLAMLHTLFTLEHNAICDHLKSAYPTSTDDQLFEWARLVNAALVAKIHTVEWTPAVISHPTTVLALRTNWWGLAGERIHKRFGRISKSEVISGIPGSQTQHYGVPYCLTEEFVAVYRMHPLLPDEYPLRSATDDHLLEDATLRSLSGPGALEALERISMTDAFYSFGRLHPGVVCLHNFPRFLQEFVRPDGQLMDMASLDIVRSRELGVPRYNEFRRLLHLKPAADFESLTDNPVWAEELSRVYGGDIEKLDLVPGMYAERRPKGFAFSDTAFRIFVLMASRRLNSDRFFTRDYRPEVYTKAGLQWVEDNTMVTVLARHYPQLGDAMKSVKNGFHPWARSGPG